MRVRPVSTAWRPAGRGLSWPLLPALGAEDRALGRHPLVVELGPDPLLPRPALSHQVDVETAEGTHLKDVGGPIHDSGRRPSTKSCRRCRASALSVFARRLLPLKLAVSAGSAAWASMPARCSSSTT